MRMMVSVGMLAVAGGLVPGALGRFDLTEHQVWALSSALVLAGWFVVVIASARTPEYRTAWATEIEATKRTVSDVVVWAVYALYMMASLLTPVIILLGVAPRSPAGPADGSGAVRSRGAE